MLFGKRLRQARMVADLRLKELADAVGCSENLLSKIENDKHRPSLQLLHKIVGRLGITIGSLFVERALHEGIVKRRGERAIIPLGSSRTDGGGTRLYGFIHIVEPGGGRAGQRGKRSATCSRARSRS